MSHTFTLDDENRVVDDPVDDDKTIDDDNDDIDVDVAIVDRGTLRIKSISSTVAPVCNTCSNIVRPRGHGTPAAA